MQDLFNKAAKFAKETAEKAADKTEELVEVGKLKSQISTAKTEINTAKKQIGEYYYEQFGAEAELPAEVKEFCTKIREQELLIEELEAKIDLVSK